MSIENEVEDFHKKNLQLLTKDPIELHRILEIIRPRQEILDRLNNDENFGNWLLFLLSFLGD